jgi:hypothetical protein
MSEQLPCSLVEKRRRLVEGLRQMWHRGVLAHLPPSGEGVLPTFLGLTPMPRVLILFSDGMPRAESCTTRHSNLRSIRVTQTHGS